MSSQLGKRYKCAECGAEILCTRAGEGVLVCCETEMSLIEAAQLPSAD